MSEPCVSSGQSCIHPSWLFGSCVLVCLSSQPVEADGRPPGACVSWRFEEVLPLHCCYEQEVTKISTYMCVYVYVVSHVKQISRY